MQYRREIDGLRALAVIPVIMFHAGFSSFSGGFIGVDVFFVISGYLITNIITEDLQSENFSLRNFYERRVRRILPALYLTILICLPFAWFWLQPADFRYFGKSIAAVTLFISNFLFQKNGYFDLASEYSSLLHTWSLAVEEQYYLLFPIVLTYIYKRGIKITVWVLILLGIASFSFAQWGVYNQPEQAFYMLPARGWELISGALISLLKSREYSTANIITSNGIIKSKEFYQLASLTGGILILMSIFYLDKSTPFPGLWALPTILGAVLIIYFATPQTIIGKILGSKPFVAVGLISYSAYLLHQPLLVFTRHRFPGVINEFVLMALILLTFMFAFLSWKFIEAPFRNKNIVPAKPMIISLIILALSFLVFGLKIRSHDGFPDRFPTLKRFYEDSQWNEALNKNDKCFERFGGEQYCQITELNQPVTDVLIGDSHSNHFFPGLSQHLAQEGKNLLQQGAGGCPPFLYIDTGKHPTHGLLKCSDRTEKLYQAIIDSKTIRRVYIAFHHSGYFDKLAYPLRDLHGEIKDEDRLDFISKALIRTIASFESSGKEVRLIYDLPDLKSGEPLNCLLREARNNLQSECNDRSLFIDNFGNYDRLIARVAQYTKIKIFYTKDYMDSFPRSPEGDWFYRDHTHLSVKGSLFFSSKFAFENIRRQ